VSDDSDACVESEVPVGEVQVLCNANEVNAGSLSFDCERLIDEIARNVKTTSIRGASSDEQRS